MDDLVAKKLAEEISKQKEQVESEVARRVQEARKHLEKMMEEQYQKRIVEQDKEISELKVEMQPPTKPASVHAVHTYTYVCMYVTICTYVCMYMFF